MKVGDLVKYQEYVYIPLMRPQLQMTTGKGVGLSGKMGIILEYDSTLKIANIQFVNSGVILEVATRNLELVSTY